MLYHSEEPWLPANMTLSDFLYHFLGIALFVGLDCSDIDSFSAGNVTLKKRGDEGTRSACASLRTQAELMLKGYLKDDGFYFGAVRC